jgi:GH25 family lysozyme M1 (1,4-beta-N-acetylmuramidase)
VVSERARGIDVSRYQGAISWPAVAEAGYAFAFIRATIGSIYKDPRCIENVTGAVAAGLLMSVYHVVRWDAPAEAQYANLAAMLAEIPAPALPIALDVELPTPAGNTPDHRQTLRYTRELLQIVHEHGVSAVIYTGAWWWNPAIRDAEPRWAARADLWTAAYTPSPRIPTAPWDTWTFWQTTSSGRVPGIDGNVDLNIFAGDREALLAYAAAATGYAASPPVPTVHTITITGHNVTIKVGAS